MTKELQLVLPPEIAFDENALLSHIDLLLKRSKSDHFFIKILKRSIDARARQIKVNLSICVYFNEKPLSLISYSKPLKSVENSKKVIIVGCGPAGLFAALKLIELGMKPVLLERGKNVKDRRRDLAAINKEHVVNPESNYCFGEGGAGTYSDGKLYTRSDKRGDIKNILEMMVAHGATEDILIDAHPHIGTNKLPKLIEEIRTTILKAGGEINFNTKVVDFEIQNSVLKSVITEGGKEYHGEGVILATGHSARDIFYLLDRKKIEIAAKPFALGVRIEHPQLLIDQIQYHCDTRSAYLPPSSYSHVTQVEYNGVEKGVFSFCMCPGGIIAPCATEEGEIVVNGWSPSKRNNPFANSGMVVSVDQTDWAKYLTHGALAALEFQKSIEQHACAAAGGKQYAPAQRMMDFISNTHSQQLNDCSYQPGIKSIKIDEILPPQITYRLREGLKIFGQKMKGYATNEAQLLGVESRTSSPIRIPRDKESCEHIAIKRLFPCGEGAGYAGGIMSAAIDGIKCAENLFKIYQ